MSKPNKDGWIRHRGGKCPVEAGTVIEYRRRKHGHGVFAAVYPEQLNWSHENSIGDIMAYRIHKPAEHGIYADDKDESSEPVQVTYVDSDGPLQWRDRITEIDRIVEALEEERVSLVQRLEGEGFRLIERAVQPVEDMSDCLNWKKGDKVMANDDSAGFGGGFHEGGIYVMREDCTNKDHSIKVVEDDNGVENGWGSKFFKFHSRPSK